MRDINDLQHEYISTRAFRPKKSATIGNTQYVGLVRTEEWMDTKIVNSTETTITDATRHNNEYTNLEDAWSNKLTLTYE